MSLKNLFMNGKKTTVGIVVVFAVHERRFFLYYKIIYHAGGVMKLVKNVIKKNLKMIIFYSLLGIIMTLMNLYSISYFQTILDAFQFGKIKIWMLIVYGILLIMLCILGYIENYPQQSLKNGLYLEFKLLALKKMKTIDYLEYQKIGTGRLTQKVEDGSNACMEVVFNFWLRLIRELIPNALFSLIFLFLIKKELIIFIIIGYIFVIIVSNVILKRLYVLKEKILINQEVLSNHLVRGFMELVVFRTNKKYDMEIELSSNGIRNIVNSKVKIKLVHEMFFSLFELLVCLLKIVILIYAVFNVNLTVGMIVTIISLLGKAYEPIAIFNVEYIDYKLNKVAFKKYIELLEIKDDKSLLEGLIIDKVDGNIKLDDVSFYYHNKKIIIDKFSLEIEKNKSIALVGESGSGKSTIIKLLMGLIKPCQGEILVDNHSLSKINLNSFYDYVTYVSQDSLIFDGTLRENLVFDKKISDKEIIKVLSYVCLDEFYNNLENGLETQLGEKGIKMSGGERQRVALARLFFDNSKIIILDEATSALDNITEKCVMKNIINLLKKRTIIIIAHRLETIKDVDNIYVLSNGKIVEFGKYNGLLKKNGYFKKLYNSMK